MNIVRISEVLSAKGLEQDHDAKARQKYGRLSEYISTCNYEGLLSLDLRHMTMVRIDGVPFELIAADIAANCPHGLKLKYPEKFLRLAYELFAGGLEDEYSALMEELKDIIYNLTLMQQKKEHLMGEWLIVSALPCVRDIRVVREKYERAAELMHGKSTVIDAADPITLGFHGFPGVYLTEPGIADELTPVIARVADLFSSFIGEPLVGMDILYEGSLAYYRCDLDAARKLTYKSIYLLESTKQDVLQITAGEQLALIATHQGDVECFAEAVEYLDRVAERSVNNLPCRSLIQLVHCGLINTLDGYKETPDWLKSFSFAKGAYGSGPSGDKNIAGNIHFAAASYGVAIWYHSTYLFSSGQYSRAFAVADTMRQSLGKSKNVPILEMCFIMLTACCHVALGERGKAVPLIEESLELAQPDGLYMLLAYFAHWLDGMVENCLEKKDINALKAVDCINKVLISGIHTLKREYMEADLLKSLTDRELEVARLAAQSMRNADIAEALCISLNTVKAHLKTVFAKLDIDKRSQLREKFKHKI